MKIKLKKTLAVLVALIMLIGLAACGDKQSSKPGSGGKTSVKKSENTYESTALGYSIELPKDFSDYGEIMTDIVTDYFVLSEAEENGEDGTVMRIIAIPSGALESFTTNNTNCIMLHEGEDYILMADIYTDEDMGTESAYFTKKKEMSDKIQSCIGTISASEISYHDLTNFKVSYTDNPITDEKKDADGNVIFKTSVSLLRAEPDGHNAFTFLNSSLEDLAAWQIEDFNDSYDESGIEEELKAAAAKNGKGWSGKYTIESEPKRMDQDVFCFLQHVTLDVGDGYEYSQIQAHNFSTFDSDYELDFIDVIRDFDRFKAALRKALKADKLVKFSSSEDQIDWYADEFTKFIYEFYSDGEEYGTELTSDQIPSWVLADKGLELWFEYDSLDALGVKGTSSLGVTIPYDDDPYIFYSEYAQWPEAKQVTVSNTKELMEAIDNNIIISLKPGTYDLSDYIFNEVGADWADDHTNVVYDPWYGFYLWNISGMTFQAEDLSAALPLISINNGSMPVFGLRYCDNITISDISFGHEVEEGSCEGSVLSLMDSYMVDLLGLDLYGCGTYGVDAVGCYGITAVNTTIHDCKDGIVILNDCRETSFYNCTFENNRGTTMSMIESYDSEVYFCDCTFSGNEGPMLPVESDAHLIFDQCTLGEHERSELDKLIGYNAEEYK